MYLLTQAIRKLLRKHPLLSQQKRESPKVLVRFSTDSGMYGCGPWTWWVLGATDEGGDDWLFAGVMESHVGAEAGVFSMEDIRRLDRSNWIPVRRIEGDSLSPSLVSIWHTIDPEKPVWLMEFPLIEVKNVEEETLRHYCERELDRFDLLVLENDTM